MLRVPVIQAEFHLVDVGRRAERAGSAIDDVARGRSEEAVDMIGTMMSACEAGSVGDVGVGG